MSRDEARRRQQAAARLRAAGISPPPAGSRKRSPLVYVAAVLALAVVVGIVVLVLNRGSGTSGTGTSGTATYKVAASKGVLTLGDTSAPVKVEIYEDYLCPLCKAFSDRDHGAITDALDKGKITVKFHPIAILNAKTTPAGYSARAANAALCAADAGIFPAYHDKLFAQQPKEYSAGLPDAQLITFGTDLGAGADFSQCVTKGAHAAEIQAETKRAAADTSLRQGDGFGTPTVTVGGKVVSIATPSWLADPVASH